MTQDEFEKCQTYITPVEQEVIDTIVKILGETTWDLLRNGFKMFQNGATYIYALQQAKSNLVELKERWLGRMKQNKKTEDEQQKIENQKENPPPKADKLVVEAAGEETVGKKKPDLDDLCPRDGERVLLDLYGYGNFMYYILLEYSEDWDLMKLRREGENGIAVTVSLSGLEKNWYFWRSPSSDGGDEPGTLWCEMRKSEKVCKGV